MSTRAMGSTVEALAYQLRGGPDALREPSAQRRLSQLDEAQLREIADRLTKWRWGKFKNGEVPPKDKRLPAVGEEGAVPPWAPVEIEAFTTLWKEKS